MRDFFGRKMSDLFAGPVERVCIGCEKAILINMVKEIKRAMFRFSTEVFGKKKCRGDFRSTFC